MYNFLKNRRFFNILTLIFLTGFLILPNISLADEFDNIDLEEMGKHLSLSEDKIETLLRSLINIFYSEWIDLTASGYSTAEEMAVPSIMKKAVRVQTLNYLLIDMPIQTTWTIVKNATKIARLFLVEDISVVIEKIEKESVNRAVKYGMNALFINEIKMAPGVIEFEYISRKGEKKTALFQYVIIYQPIDNKNGKILIRFYSINFLEPPIDKGSYGMAVGMYTELTDNLPPFIVDIQGLVENYQWVGNTSMKIDFSGPVPDLGIKPLNFWEKYLLKPIETTIKDVNIIITKVTGKSLGLTDVWNKIKSFISKIANFSPAAIVETELPRLNSFRQGGLENISNIINPETKKLSLEKNIKAEPQIKELIEKKPIGGSEPSLEEIQEILDDISERVDVLNQQVFGFAGAGTQQTQVQKTQAETGKKEEIKKSSEEPEKIEESDESKLTEGKIQTGGKDTILCERTGQPARSKVIFNEIAWMGGIISANDEWIELKNISGSQIDLRGWQILNKEKKMKILFSENYRGAAPVISAGGFWLLERTSDESVPSSPADLIYSGALKNSDEVLYLFDGNCQLQDEITAGSSWLAGDNSSKRTMERKHDLNWQTSQNPGGTPKAENSSGHIEYLGGGGGGSAVAVESSLVQTQPRLALSYSQNNPSDREIEAILSASNLKNTVYDVKISIEKGTTTLSEIYNERINDWQSSYNYTTSVFSGTSFSGNFKLRIKDSESSFRGEADIAAKIRETEKSSAYLEFSGKINITDPGLEQNQLPIASFAFSPQNPIANQEIIFNAASSTDSDGVIVSYIWDFGDINSATTSQATTTHFYSTSGVEYAATVWVVDNQGATSSPATAAISVIEPNLAQNIIISEVLASGTEEFIELYNPTSQTVSLSGKYFAYFSQNNGWTEPHLKKEFTATSTIASSSHYLIAFGGYSNNPASDWKPYSTTTHLRDEAGAVGIFSSSTISESTKIDVFGWKEENIAGPIVFEGSPFSFEQNEINGKSFQRKKNQEDLYFDGNDNSIDFETGLPSPINSRNERGNILPPIRINDLSVVQINDFTIQLSWLTPFDPDTSQTELLYDIRYLRNAAITDENWASSTLAENPPLIAGASTTQVFTISELNYQTIYSFAIKTFDGRNYSFLSNTASLQTSLPQNPSPWPMYQYDSSHLGQSSYSGPAGAASIQWTFSPVIPGSIMLIHSPAIDADGTIYLANSNGFFAISAAGAEKWRYSVEIGVPITPAIASDGSIHFISSQSLIALNRDGALKWEFPIDSYYPDVHPLIYNGKIYILAACYFQGETYPSPCLKAIDLDGNLIWSFELSEQERAEARLTDCNPFVGVSSPAVDSSGTVYFGFAKNLFAVDSFGNEKWKILFNICGISPPTIFDDRVYVGADEVYAVNPENGTTVRSFVSLSPASYYFPPTIVPDGTLYIITGLGNLFCLNAFNASTSDLKWKTCASGYWSSQIVDSEGVIYFFNDRWLNALNPADGSLKWRLEISQSNTLSNLSLAIGADGAIYVSGNNSLYVVK